jgi:hypothetical protein
VLQYVCLSISDVGKAYKPAIALLLRGKVLYPTLTAAETASSRFLFGTNPRVRMRILCDEVLR